MVANLWVKSLRYRTRLIGLLGPYNYRQYQEETLDNKTLIDLHSHSVSSDDGRATVEQYLRWIQVLRKQGHQIDGIVLTEHRKFDSAANYSTLANQYGVVVLKGSELDTRYGHFLVYGVNPRLLDAIDFTDVNMDPSHLIYEAKCHGAVVVPAHPGRPRIGLCHFIDMGLQFGDLKIIEELNGGSRDGENERASALVVDLGAKGTGGSDAHLTSSIGSCLTEFDAVIRTDQELVEALLWREYKPITLKSGNMSSNRNVEL